MHRGDPAPIVVREVQIPRLVPRLRGTDEAPLGVPRRPVVGVPQIEAEIAPRLLVEQRGVVRIELDGHVIGPIDRARQLRLLARRRNGDGRCLADVRAQVVEAALEFFGLRMPERCGEPGEARWPLSVSK